MWEEMYTLYPYMRPKDTEKERSIVKRYDEAWDKAAKAKTPAVFVKHCHTLIHLCSESLSIKYDFLAHKIFTDLSNLIQSTKIKFV
jgi:hypothetical protein